MLGGVDLGHTWHAHTQDPVSKLQCTLGRGACWTAMASSMQLRVDSSKAPTDLHDSNWCRMPGMIPESNALYVPSSPRGGRINCNYC